MNGKIPSALAGTIKPEDRNDGAVQGEPSTGGETVCDPILVDDVFVGHAEHPDVRVVMLHDARHDRWLAIALTALNLRSVAQDLLEEHP